MLEHINQYYLDERSGAVPAFIAAAVFLIVGSILLAKFSGNALSKGMGISFLVICLLLISVAISSIVFNNKKIEELQSMKAETEQTLQQREIQRMDKVMNITFKYAFIIFAVLMVIALCIIIFSGNDLWKGVGIGLMLLVALAIISDSFSMQRNRQYQQMIMAIPTTTD